MTAREPGAEKPKPPAKTPVIGLTGGIASGKSTVAKHLGELGAVVINADAIAHEVLQSPVIRNKIQAHWGDALLDAQGHPDRARIADHVFENPHKLAMLNSWVHPPTLEKIRAYIDKARRNPDTPMIVIDAPLLIETGRDAWCDIVVFIDTTQSERAKRTRADRNWPLQELTRREGRQCSLDKKRQRADYILDNNGPPEALPAKVAELFHALTRTSDSPQLPPHHSRRQ